MECYIWFQIVCLLCHWNKNHNTLSSGIKSPANQDIVICVPYHSKHATHDKIIITLTLPVKKSKTLISFGTCV